MITRVEEKHSIMECAKRYLLMTSGWLLGVSIAMGLLCTVLRLLDFSKTAFIARIREKMQEAKKSRAYINRKLRSRRLCVRDIGNCSWGLFYAQVLTFLAGVVCAAYPYITN